MTEKLPNKRLRRTMLLTPGNRPERLQRAAQLDVDSVVFDLEDGVSSDHKQAAREIVNHQLTELDFGHRERLVRVNAVATEAFNADMKQLDFENIDALFVPKVEAPEQLEELDDMLVGIEMANGRSEKIDVVATIETPRGLLNALKIADASNRTSALFFGSGDYSAATGAAVANHALAFPRATIVAAASAAGLQPIDAAYFVAVKDAEATAEDAQLAKEMGFEGKVIFHPNQIAACNTVFSPGQSEIERARKIVAAYESAKREGNGTAFVDGEFIAVDIALMAERVLRQAEQIAARQTD